jgi:hypothetical protein
MLSRSARGVLDTALQKYRPGHSVLISVGGIDQLKPALRLMVSYRLVLQNVVGAEAFTIYTRWLESVEVKEGAEPRGCGTGSLCGLQPAVREDLAGVQEASRGLHGPEAGRSQAPEQVRVEALRLGEKARQRWKREHFAGGSPESSSASVRKGRGRQRHSRGAYANLGELPPESAGCRDPLRFRATLGPSSGRGLSLSGTLFLLRFGA